MERERSGWYESEVPIHRTGFRADEGERSDRESGRVKRSRGSGGVVTARREPRRRSRAGR
jgi:hypothetical protein